jgi:hypothetical protein
MSVDSVLDDRYAMWVDELDAWGYEIEEPPRPAPLSGILIRGRRPESFGLPCVVIDIAETWQAGADPDGLRITNRGCFLLGASWHAQFPTSGDAGAERLDVDRTKSRTLMVHRHPLGESNEVRESVRWQRPGAWLERIELLIIEYGEDEED